MAKEFTYYADANGIKIGSSRLVFGEHAYSTSSVRSVSVVRENQIRWPGIAVNFAGLAMAAYGILLDSTSWLILGLVGMISGAINLSRKRSKFGLMVRTDEGSFFVVASNSKAYVEQIERAVRRTIGAIPEG